MPASRDRRRIALALLCLAAAAMIAAMLAPRYPFDAGDWLLRWREMRALKTGVDPFDIFTRRVQDPVYVSLLDAHPGDPAVHNYAPWAYGFCFPAAYLSRRGAVVAAAVGNALALFLLAGLIFALAHERTGRSDRAAAIAAAALLLDLFPLFRAFTVGNFSIVAAAAAFALALLLERKRDLLAGAMLALLMLKIQIGLVFLVPLVLGRRWRTLAVGGALCFAAACLPAACVGKSPLTLAWQLLFSGDPSFLSPYTGGLFSIFARHLSAPMLLAADAVVALGVLGFVSWRLRDRGDWLLKLAPAAAIVPLWNYSQTIDLCLLLVPLVYFLIRLERAETRRERGFAALAILFFSAGLAHALWNILVLSGWFIRPEGLGGLFVGGLALAYLGWLAILLLLARERPDHS